MGNQLLPTRKQRLAARRQAQWPHRAVEQRRAYAGLKLRDGLRNRRLRHLQMRRTLRHAAKFDGHHEYFECVQIEFLWQFHAATLPSAQV